MLLMQNVLITRSKTCPDNLRSPGKMSMSRTTSTLRWPCTFYRALRCPRPAFIPRSPDDI